MFKVIKKVDNPDILVVTPLLEKHLILDECKESITYNTAKFDWVSFSSNNVVPKNLQEVINRYRKKYELPDYIMGMGRDIICGMGLLDKLISTLKNSNDNVGFAYCPFEYKGSINLKIPPIEYDINKLKISNYISGNCMYKKEALENVGEFKQEADYDLYRLNDWAMFLKLYSFGYIGKLCKEAYFTAISTKNDISSGNSLEYQKYYNFVKDNYINNLKLM